MNQDSHFNFLLLFCFSNEKVIYENTFLQISYDIVEDIIIQGDRLRDTLQELQDAVYVTKVL